MRGERFLLLARPNDSCTQLNIPFVLESVVPCRQIIPPKPYSYTFPNFILRLINSYLRCLLVFPKCCQGSIPDPFCSTYKQFDGFSSNSDIPPKCPEKHNTSYYVLANSLIDLEHACHRRITRIITKSAVSRLLADKNRLELWKGKFALRPRIPTD